MTLQARVSAALEALPRGREPSPPGERFRRDVMSAMPDIEAMELVEQFFAVGSKVVGTVNTVAIFLAGCRECLPERELQANRRRHPADHAQDLNGQPPAGFSCPRGQVWGGASCEGGVRGWDEGRHRENEPVVLGPWAVALPAPPNGHRFVRVCSCGLSGVVRLAACGGASTS